MIENYKKYLEFLDSKLSGFFEKQKEYICCKKGCSKCCRNAEFPFSLLEFKYMLDGFILLDKNTQNIIENKIAKIVEDKKNFTGEKFFYDCPFLIDDICSVYAYRGVVCRSFGLLIPDSKDENNTKIPFCYKEGLNYSVVIDEETQMISSEKFEKTGFKNPPLGFFVSHNSLTSSYFEKTYNIKFGKKDTLINWIIALNS